MGASGQGPPGWEAAEWAVGSARRCDRRIRTRRGYGLQVDAVPRRGEKSEERPGHSSPLAVGARTPSLRAACGCRRSVWEAQMASEVVCAGGDASQGVRPQGKPPLTCGPWAHLPLPSHVPQAHCCGDVGIVAEVRAGPAGEPAVPSGILGVCLAASVEPGSELGAGEGAAARGRHSCDLGQTAYPPPPHLPIVRPGSCTACWPRNTGSPRERHGSRGVDTPVRAPGEHGPCGPQTARGQPQPPMPLCAHLFQPLGRMNTPTRRGHRPGCSGTLTVSPHRRNLRPPLSPAARSAPDAPREASLPMGEISGGTTMCPPN